MKNTSKNIWKSLAFIQSKIDDIFNFGFKKISEIGDKQLSKDTHKVKEITHKMLWFIWNIWKSYYSSYNKIKEEKSKNSEK